MATPAGPYTPAVRAGDFLYLSGQIGFDDSNNLVEGFEAQARKSIANLFTLLQQNGAAKEHLVKTVCFVTDAANLTTMNEIYAELFGDHLPARSTVVVVGLPKGAIFEIEGIAHVG
jgi:2-iminobutanoate/2-iminopropanoate deaminase